MTLLPRVQPYSPVTAACEQGKLFRTQQPLITGPLNVYPRPYEAQLLDAIRNPRRLFLAARARHNGSRAGSSEMLMSLPAVEEENQIPADVGESTILSQEADPLGPTVFGPPVIRLPATPAQ